MIFVFFLISIGPSWHPGCPVPISKLRELRIPYWDYTGHRQTGTLIVNESVASEVQEIFHQLYEHHFPIQRMQPVDAYGADDERSMEANNTSAFNCRDVTGEPGKFSNHSWGLAIDINPLTNPYIKGNTVLPPEGRKYLDRTRDYTGAILPGSSIVKLFEKHGWTWGGNWTDRKDYQHFEKPDRAVITR